MGLYTGMEKVAVNVGEPRSRNPEDNYLLEGTHVLEVNRILEHTKENGAKVFIAEFKVVESSNEKMKPGQVRSFIENFKFVEHAKVRIKQLILAAADGEFSSDEVTEEIVNAVVGPKNPLAGKRLKVLSKPGKKGGPFLYHNFYKA